MVFISSEDQVDPESTESFLILNVFLAPELKVDQDLRGLGIGFCLESDPKPAMTIAVAFYITRCYRICKSKETSFSPTR